ncbi:MAG: hypothetical protein GDA40_12180 [Rhodobacteraceae bacterium]|nr:hypothetical protein [Paracoccaceae bacterium]
MQPKKIVIHPGFHKTGTTTLQAVLRQNRALLRPYLKSILPGEIKSLLQAARGYSMWRDPFTREKFRSRFRAPLAKQDQLRGPCLCISTENLSGHLSGRGSLGDFSAAIALTKDMARITTQTVCSAEIQFYFSTRAAKPWLDSAYWEHVKSSSMTMDLDTFNTRFSRAGDFDPLLAKIATNVPIAVNRLEEVSPAPWSPLLTLCGVHDEVQDNLAQTAPKNLRLPQQALDALLTANRELADRRTTKQAIIATHAEAPS